MLDYFKTILEKVSFDAMLFEKELRKAIAALVKTELMELKEWCYAHFYSSYKTVLERNF